MSTSVAIQQEALTRATSSQSLANFATIIRGFMAKGLPESEILPRENVFTYNAWRALGRQVRKGEHGVKCITVITTTDKRTGREQRRPWTTTVFHVSQTEKIGAQACNEALDATAENIPYAGEAETDEAELQAHSDAVHAGREAAPVFFGAPRPANINGYPEVCEDCGQRRTCNGAGQCHQCRQADIDREREYEEQRERETPEPPKIEKFSPEATVETFTLDEQGKLVRETPEPEPAKDSAYDRAMRGETINIMDLIAEQSTKRETLAQHDRRIDREYRAAKRNVQQVYQSKTVEF